MKYSYAVALLLANSVHATDTASSAASAATAAVAAASAGADSATGYTDGMNKAMDNAIK